MKMNNAQETPIGFTQTLSFVWKYKDNQIRTNCMSSDIISKIEYCDNKELNNEEATYDSTILEHLNNKLAESIIEYIKRYNGSVTFCKSNPVDGIGQSFITHFKTKIDKQEFTIIVLAEGDYDKRKKLGYQIPNSSKVFVCDHLAIFKYWYNFQLKLSELRHNPVDTCITKKYFGRTLGHFVNPYLKNNKEENLEGGLRDETN